MEADPEKFFARAYDVFRSAPDGRGEVYRIRGLFLRIETTPALKDAGLTRAFAHLHSATSVEPQFTICAWDSSEGRMIAPAWTEADYGKRGAITGFNNARFRTAFDHASSALSMVDLEERLALFWTTCANQLPLHQIGAPFRNIIASIAEREGLVLVHCGAVRNEHGAALFAGAGGSGKSTTALLCAAEGWRYLADDYCIVDPGDAPRVYSLYNSAKLTLRSAAQFGLAEMVSARHADDGKKELFFMPEGRLADSADVRVLLLPRVTSQPVSSIETATPAEALRALAPSSMFQLAGAGTIAFQRLGAFVRKLPVRRLNLGRDFARIPQLIEECITRL